MKKEKGFTTVDLSIAVIVLILFVTIMTSMIYSVYMSSTEAKRTATALNYCVDIFEAIGQSSYQSVKASNILNNMQGVSDVDGNETSATGQIGNGTGAYKINLKVENPYLTDDTIRLITLNVEFKISASNTQNIELQRIKVNKPVQI